MKKLTIEHMHNIAKERKGECLTKIYKNNKEKMIWKCEVGHIWKAIFLSIQKGTWCPKCYGRGIYSFDAHFFDKINTEAKAYFFGFLLADGYNPEKRNDIILQLDKKDIEILYQFKKIIKSTYPIYQYNYLHKKGGCPCVFRVNSHYMSKVLFNHGMVHNKTESLDFPICIPDHLLHHFIRGFFDGDGSFKKDKNSLNFVICGTINVLSKLRNILIKKCFLKRHNKLYFPKKMPSYFRTLSYSGNDALRIRDYMYNKATLYLLRKYNIAFSYDYKYRGKEVVEMNKEKIKQLYLKGKKIYEIAKIIKCDRHLISPILKNLRIH